jgi:hypothetical protein
VTAPRAWSSPDRERRYWRAALLVTWLATLVRLLFAFRLPLFPDETYYWEWSRRLEGGYFDHPPMIAWLMAAWPGLRFWPVIAGGVAGLATSAIARRPAGGEAAV